MRSFFQRGRVSRVVAGLALLLPMVGSAETTEEARALLEKASAFYRGLDAFQVTTKMALEMSGEGLRDDMREELIQTISVRRPDAFALVSKGEGQFLSYPMAYLHGEQATLVLPQQGIVRQEGVPTIEAFFSSERLGYSPAFGANFLFEQNVGLSFLNKLAYAELGGNWQDDLTGIEIAEADTKIDGREAVHLVLKTRSKEQEPDGGGGMNLHVWVAKGDQPLLLELQPDVKQMVPRNDPSGKVPVQMKIIVEWRDWRINPDLPDSVFNPPPDLEGEEFEGVGDLMEATLGGQAPAMDLLGALAPEVRLPVAGREEPFVLKGFEGKKIVVLIFWATWCEPCKEAIPVLLESTKRFADKDVVLVGVNVQEPEDVVAPFLQREKIDLLTALDVDGRASAAFRVRNIPQTVIIGRDGHVKHVHVGVGPDFEALLNKELEGMADVPDPGAEATPDSGPR